MWWVKKGTARSISKYLGKVESKDIWADENNEIYVKQKFGIIAGVNKAKMKLPEERMEDISKKLGFKLKIGREGLRLYETYSENPPLSRRPKLIEKLIKVSIIIFIVIFQHQNSRELALSSQNPYPKLATFLHFVYRSLKSLYQHR